MQNSKRMGMGLAVVLFSILGAVAAVAEPAASVSGERVKPMATTESAPKTLWYDARELAIEGKGWQDTEAFWDRLPARAKGKVTDAVWGHSKKSAGMAVLFNTDAGTINIRWTVTMESLAMPHMPATGMSGLDLYARDGGVWRWVGNREPKAVTNEGVFAEVTPQMREYMLYLPLYNGVKSLEIGLPSKAVMLKPAAREAKPIVVYGTSIAHGGCASRPGMAHVAIVGRRLNRPMINLGFSGSGKMEMEMESLLAELDAAVYVLDCLPNMDPQMIAARLEPFVKELRKARPNTPIVLVENPTHGAGLMSPKWLDIVAGRNGALREAYQRLLDADVKGLTYVPGDQLIGMDGDGTVDGVHPTDLGFWRMAELETPILRKVLGE